MADIPIPAACAHRPTVGGRVAPWINVALADGGIDFRHQHRARVIAALRHKLCQVCGTLLRHPIIVLGGPSSLKQLLFEEPPLHPECAVYTSRACPMVAGELDRFATGPSVSEGARGKKCAREGCGCGGWVRHDPADHGNREVHDWYAVYASGFTTAYRPDGDVIGALIYPGQVLKVILVSSPRAGRCWIPVPVSEALAGYEAPVTSLEGQ